MENSPMNALFKNLVRAAQITHDQCNLLTALSGQYGAGITRYHYKINDSSYGLVCMVLSYDDSWMDYFYLADLEHAKECQEKLLPYGKSEDELYEVILHSVWVNGTTISDYINDNLKEKLKHE